MEAFIGAARAESAFRWDRRRAETRTAVIPAKVLSPRAAALELIKAFVLDTLPSPESKRAYGQALDNFFRWCEAAAVSEFTKAVVNSYRASLEARKLSPSTAALTVGHIQL